MDPNAALKNMREAIEEFRKMPSHNLALVIADHADALDQWLAKDGFLPTDWAPEVEEPEFVLAVHKDIDFQEDACDGFLGQTMWGTPRCNKCDKTVQQTMMPEDPTGPRRLMYALTWYTDKELAALMKRMEER